MRKAIKREMVTQDEIDVVFSGTNFGSSKPEDIIKWSLLKVASGYSTGHTAKIILQELGLLSKAMQPKLTTRGQYCLWFFFEAGYRNK